MCIYVMRPIQENILGFKLKKKNLKIYLKCQKINTKPKIKKK